MSDFTLPRHAQPGTQGLEARDAANGIGPGEIVALLRRNLLPLLLCALLFGGIAYIGAKTLLPTLYTASGLVAVDTQSVAIPALEGALKGDMAADPMPVVRSEVEELQSPTLILAVVRDLGLEKDPEFNGTLRPPGLIARLRSRLFPAPASGAPSQNLVDQITVGTVRSRLNVSNDGQSLIITVNFMSESPERAAAVVNSVIQHYLSEKQAARVQVDQQANATLTQRLNQVRDDVNGLENRIQQTRQRYELVQTRAGSVSQQQLEDLSTALTRASDDRANLEAQYARANALASTGGVAEDTTQVLSSTTISTLRDREAAAERRVADLSQTFGPGYPTLRAAEAQLASARGALTAEAHRVVVALGAQVQVARQRETDLQQQLATAQTKASQMATVQADLQQLEKDADARRALYQTLLVSAEQTDSSKQGPQQVGSHVVSLATPPAFPSAPRPKMAAAFGMIGGFAFASFITLLRRTRSVAFTDPETMAAATGLEVLPSIPRAKGRKAVLPRLVGEQPNGAEAEAMRALRSRLRGLTSGPVPRSLLFVSGLPGEGSSSLAAAFARNSALDGQRVLLVEGDIATPSLAGLLDMPADAGLINTLLGREHWREAVRRDPASTLDTLLASPPDDDAVDAGRLIESMQLQSLLAEVRDEYNLVVLDAPAIADSPAASVLARAVDTVILVVESGRTHRDDVLEAVTALGTPDARPPLLVLNQA